MRPSIPLPLAMQNALNKQRQQARDYYHAHKAPPPGDPALAKPVGLLPPPPRHAAAERVRLQSELGCLRREQAATQRAIDRLLTQLAA